MFFTSLFRCSIAQEELLWDTTLITKLSMDIDLGNSLFVGNKSRNTAIEILLGENIKNQNLRYLKKLVIKDPVINDFTLEKEIQVDLKLNRSLESIVLESSDSVDNYIDLSKHESGTLLVLYHPETNMSLANKSEFQADCEEDVPDVSGNYADNKTKGCICTSVSPTNLLGEDLEPWSFESCLNTGILSNTLTPVYYAISDLEFNDVLDDILLFAEDTHGEEVLLAQYKNEMTASNIELAQPIPINQFDPEINIGIGGIHRATNGKISIAYSESTVLDRERNQKTSNLFSDYRWQPKAAYGRLNNPFTGSPSDQFYEDGTEEDLQIKSGRTTLHHGAGNQFPNSNLWNFLDTRPLHIWSELAWGNDLNDRRIYWKIRVKYYQGRLIKGQTNGSDSWGFRKDNNINDENENTLYYHVWLPQDPNSNDLDTKGSIHTSGKASGVFSGALKYNVSSIEECSPLLKLALSDGSEINLFPDDYNVKEYVEFNCSDPSPKNSTTENSFQLNLVKPELPDKIEQPIFKDKLFDGWISNGQFFMSDIGLVELGWQNIVAMDKENKFSDPSKIVLRSPETHYQLKSYIEFPFYPGHYESTGSTAESIGDDPWNRRKDKLCEKSSQSFVSDLKNYVHSSFHSGDLNAPSPTWAVDPAYGYCEYCGIDECCCNRLNSSELIRDNNNSNNIGQRFEEDPLNPLNPLEHLLTGWTTESPLNRTQQPCSWDEELRSCARTATYCSDCNLVGKLSAPSCCLNLSQAPNGPRCIWEDNICEDAPKECQACNTKDNSKDCCHVRRDECTWLQISELCSDIIVKCEDCIDTECCASIEDNLLCKWNTSSAKCETSATTCDDCQMTGVWTEGCCNNVNTIDCEYIGNECLTKPQSCDECNLLNDKIIPGEDGLSAEINHRQEECCKSDSLDCIWLTNRCESTVDSCVKCNDLHEYTQECCIDMDGDLGCSYDPEFGCLPDTTVSCEDCNALNNEEDCCLERPWCQWYNSDGTIGASKDDHTNNKHGVCMTLASSCEDCNLTPFVQTCCTYNESCAMFEKVCHDKEFTYLDKCYEGYMMGDVILATACLSFFGLILAIIIHWLASDDRLYGGDNIEVEDKVMGAGIAVVNEFDDLSLLSPYQDIPSSD